MLFMSYLQMYNFVEEVSLLLSVVDPVLWIA